MDVLSQTVLAEGVASTPLQLGELVDTAAIAAGLSLVAPLVVSFITKREASDRVKAIMNLFSVAVASVIAFVLKGGDGQPVTWQSITAVFMAGLTASLVAYRGALKPLKVTTKIAEATENFGVGTPVPAITETARPGGEVL